MKQRETLEQFHSRLIEMLHALDAMLPASGCDEYLRARLADACAGLMVAKTGVNSALRLKLPDEVEATR